jgi:MarR family 2-MHQ and catechol resistance regulon transcriptional repressor
VTATRALAREIERLFALLVRERGRFGEEPDELTTTQRLALATVVDEGPLRLHALATLMGTTDPTATRTVDSLEASGLVERTADPADGRGVLVAATTKGARTVARKREQLVRLLQQLLSRMPDEELTQLVDLLADLNERLSGVAGRV